MNILIKAVLLSAFVCPGAGHFFLKQYRMGWLFFIAFCLDFYFIMASIIEQAQKIVAQMLGGGMPLDVISLTENISGMVSNTEQSLTAPIYVMLTIWLISIIDSYRLGRRQL